ncbi:MAG: VOC family protein [Chloroflexi bacterium CFX4]|nr:VOC family protein [Chloroflexi bacterium CFX4]MDL1922828.1 VOC family protein [Chloroflexi bacterium CFX3]
MERPPISEHITFVYVPDLKVAARFYGEWLGLPLALDQGGCRIYRAAAESYIGVCQRQGADASPKQGVILTLVSEDVDGWYAFLSAQGVLFETPPQINTTYGIYHCFLRDPAGYLVEIQRFLNPDWDQSVR